MKKVALCSIFLLLPPLFLTPAAAQPTYVKGQPVILQARVLDDLGNPISGLTLHFEDQTDDVYLGYDITDAEGSASVVWDTSSASVGLHKIHVWNVENGDLYAEESHAYLQVWIVAPAMLSYSVQGPSVVKPGAVFVVVVSIENLGGASIKELVVTLGNSRYVIGTLKGGMSSQATFRFISPESSGNYTIKGSICGREEGTEELIEERFKVNYRVKMKGFGISISAPSSVNENDLFDFSIILNNIGERDLKVDVEVALKGGMPKSFFQTVKVPPKRSKRIPFSATAGTGDLINITAVAISGDIRESDQATIRILHLPEPNKPSQTLSPSPQPSQTKIPLTPPVSTQTPSSNPIPSEGPSPSIIPQKTPSEETSPNTVKTTPKSVKEKPSIVIILSTFSILMLFSYLRRIWKVEEP